MIPDMSGTKSFSRRPEFSRRDLTKSLIVAGASAALPGVVLGWAAPAWAAGWEKIGDKEGISVFKKEMPGTPLHAFRGTAIVNAPMEKVMWVLADNTHRAEWVDRLKKSVILERKSKYDFVVYQHFGSPPLVSDRDFVYRARAHSEKEGTVILDIASVEHPKAPPTVGVRGELKFSSYRFERRGEDKTHVDVAVALDPKGALPSWVVNMIQKSWPYNTLSSLRKQVQKPFVGRLEAPPVR